MPRKIAPTRTHVRKPREERKAEFAAAAYKIADEQGLQALSRASVARVCGVTPALLNSYYDGVNGLLWETVTEAGKQKNVKVLAAALGMGYQLPDLEGVSSKALMQQAKKLAAAEQ